MFRLACFALRRVRAGPVLRSCRQLSLSGTFRSENGGPLSFHSLSLSEDIQKKLMENGFESMFEIQQKSLPICLSGKDIVGRAETGSGKTLCFALPVIEKLRESEPGYEPRSLMIFPTRELAIQVHDCIQSFAPTLRLCLVYGGVRYDGQQMKLRRGCDVVLGTPGRLLSWLNRGDLRLNKIKFLVLDEADELLRQGHYEFVQECIRSCPSDRQTLLFSATFPKEAREVAMKFMKNPEYIYAQESNGSVPSSIKQIVIEMKEGREVGIIMHLLNKYKPRAVIIFVSKRRSCSLLANYLKKIGVRCSALNGDVNQSKREAILRDFYLGHFPVLVATDVAARGLDVKHLDLVVQVEPPPSGVTYHTHRSGRTGRAGRPGTSVVLYYGYQTQFLKELREVDSSFTVERAPEPKDNPEKPWEGVLHEDFAFGGHYKDKDHPAKKRPYGVVKREDRQPFGRRSFGRQLFENRQFGHRSFDRQPYGRQSFGRQQSDYQSSSGQPYDQESFGKWPYRQQSYNRPLFDQRPDNRYSFRHHSSGHVDDDW